MTETYDIIPSSQDKSYKEKLWGAAFGLQQTDGLQPSEYVQSLANQHINGELGYEKIYAELNNYYTKHPSHRRSKEADIVSARIVEILDQNQFQMAPFVLKSIHRYLFKDVLPADMTPGEYRTVNITKQEPVLDGDTVIYTPHFAIEDTLLYDFQEEMKKDYDSLSAFEKINALENFVSGIWQIHPFREGNTRTTAVFTILYARSLGFKVDNQPFETNAQYFRDALVLADTSDKAYQTRLPLDDFFFQLIEKGSHDLPPLRK